MDNQKKKLFLNPVLAAPWKSQAKNHENPRVFLCSTENRKKGKKDDQAKSNIRQRNIESLKMRFPGLRKYEARAALTMSRNQLEKAIILLEVSNCYREEIYAKRLQLAHLKNIHINLFYDCDEEQDLSIRNIVFKSSVISEMDSSASINETQSSPNHESDLDNIKDKRVGIVITKTNSGYKATPFGDNSSE